MARASLLHGRKPSGSNEINLPFPFGGPRIQVQPAGAALSFFWYKDAMRPVAFLALVVLAGRAQAEESRTVRDAAGRIEITVPVSWEDQPLAEGELMHLYAARSGGHVLVVVREAGQAEVDKQRDRYMEHDAAGYPGAEFQKIADPFFGYRMNDQVKNRVFLRAFLRDGADGLVATLSSRFTAYDRAYAAQTIAALGTWKLVSGAPPAAVADADSSRRIFDAGGRFSFVAPGAWKTITAEEGEILSLGHKGSSSTATIKVVDEGSNDNPTLILLTLQGRMKRDYASATAERVSTDPPALLVKNRKEGWVDYMIAFAAGGHGYTLRLASREGAFDGFQPVADAMAKSLVLMGDPYREPESLPGDLTRDTKKGVILHAMAEAAAAADQVAGEIPGFDKDWGRIAPVPARKGTPLHIVLTSSGAFAETAHGFGDPPAAYDRLACAVVAVPPPSDKEAAALWRGRLRAALAEAALHRDLPVAPPPWLLAGLCACMDAAGRSGEGPAAKHVALLPLLDPDKVTPLKDVFAYTYTDVIQGETPQPLAMSWGYAHMMIFGKGTLHSIYGKWTHELAKATRTAPPLDLGKYSDAETEMKRYIERELRK